jgi:acyl-CoA reductase-like NAD-dependent aldehyde dehydrogenase
MTNLDSLIADLGRLNSPYIAGRCVGPTRAGTTTHVDPSTGRPVADAHLGGAAEIDAAVESARVAQKQWIALPPSRRAAVLHRFADLIESDEVALCDVLALDAGVPASMGVSLATAWVRHFAGWADKITGVAGDASLGPGLYYTRLEPYGVVGVVIPWNHPLIATCQVAVPALAAGNAVVLKPPSATPYTALRIGRLAIEAGMPAGLLNVVPGDAEAGEALIRHRGIGKVSFTGGVATARRVMAIAAEVLKPVFLELGGKSPNLLFADAVIPAQVPFSLFFAMGMSGQGCVLPTRLLVEAPIYDEVVHSLSQLVAQFQIGPAIDRKTTFGPVINARACERILGVVERAVDEGEGRLVAGGRRVGGALADGYFIEPTIFADVQPRSRLAREEIFGPVLSVMRFETEGEAVALANDSELGLGAYVQTGSLERAHRLAAHLEAGYVNINGFSNMEPAAPFGGYKQSGFGRFGGLTGLQEYQTKTVFIAPGPGDHR